MTTLLVPKKILVIQKTFPTIWSREAVLQHFVMQIQFVVLYYGVYDKCRFTCYNGVFYSVFLFSDIAFGKSFLCFAYVIFGMQLRT